MHSLADGRLQRRLGSKGHGPGQFDFITGGVCTTPRCTLLVAEDRNDRVQEVAAADGSHVRFLGGALDAPTAVDCNGAVVAVSQTDICIVTILDYGSGAVRARCGNRGVGYRISQPAGVRLLADGTGLFVAESGGHHVFELGLDGGLLKVMGGGVDTAGRHFHPVDVVEYGRDCYLAIQPHAVGLAVMRAGDVVGACPGSLYMPRAMAVVPARRDGGGGGISGGDGVVVREWACVHVFHDLCVRMAWLCGVATLARHLG